MRPDFIVIASVRSQDAAQMRLAQDYKMNHAIASIDLINRSAKPFCQGEAGSTGLSRLPMARNRRVTTAP
jgi:hypothetical protein